MSAYYNEIDPYAAQWLRNLIAAGHIAPGEVDERSIIDVHADDLKGFTQCHFFAGIAGWSLALRRAGWSDDRPVWTGSCPCQPFSAAGKQAGFDDPRHLWPQLKRIVEKRLPPVFFGEQVASATAWLALVRSDLEAMGYAMGAIPLEAAGATADHFRDRFWFVADYDLQRSSEEREQRGGELRRPSCNPQNHNGAISNGNDTAWRTDGARGHDDERPAAGWDQSAGHASERRAGDVVDTSSIGWGEGWTEHEFRSRGSPLPSQVSAAANTSNAPTEGGAGSLHPEFAGWELGFPPEWLSCAPSGTPSTGAPPPK